MRMRITTRTLRRWLAVLLLVPLTVVGLLLLLVIVVLSIAPVVDLGSRADKLSAALSVAGKRQVSLAGGSVRIGWRPALTLQDVVYARMDGGSTGKVYRASQLHAGIGLLPLLTRQVRVHELTGHGVVYESHPRRPRAVASPSPDPAAPLATPAVSQSPKVARPKKKRYTLYVGPFSFTDAAVRWLDETGRTRREFTFSTLTGQSPFRQAVQLTCEAAWDGRPFSGELTTGPLVDLLTDQPQWPVAGTITYSNSVVQGAGFIGDDGTLVFDISGQSPSLQEIVSIVGFDLPPLGPCSLTGRVTVAKGAFKVEAMQGRLGSGAVKVEVSRQKQVDGRSLLRCHALLEGNTLEDLAVFLGKSITGMTGTLGRVSVGYEQATSSEKQKQRALMFEAAGVALNYGEAFDKSISLANIDLVDGTNGLQVELSGAWLGQGFGATLDTSSLFALKATPQVPIAFGLHCEETEVAVAGTLALTGDAKAASLAVALDCRRLGALSKWLGVAPDLPLPLRLNTQITLGGGRVTCAESAVQIGESDLAGEIAYDFAKGVLLADLRSILLDLNDLSTIGESPKESPAIVVADSKGDSSALLPEATRPAGTLDIPILPERLVMPDIDAKLAVSRLQINEFAVTELNLDATVEDGSLLPSHLSYNCDGMRFAGQVALDTSGEIPAAELHVSAEHADVGQILANRGIASNVVLTVERAAIDMRARGKTLAEVLDWADVSCSLTNGVFTYSTPGATQALEVVVSYLEVHGAEDERVTVAGEGAVDGDPLSFELDSRWPLKGAERLVPIKIQFRTDQERLLLEGHGTLPFDLDAAELRLNFEGEDLAQLSVDGGPSLPSMGPYRLGATLRTTDQGYLMTNLVIAVGASLIEGWARVDTAGERPFVAASIDAGSIQLDDLALSEWTVGSTSNQPAPAASRKEKPAVEAKAAEAVPSEKESTVDAIVRDIDADLRLRVGEVLSGSDRLGAAEVKLRLDRGHLTISPCRVEIPGGMIEAFADYQEVDDAQSLDLRARMSNFDYGVLARRLGTTNEFVRGILNLDMHIVAKAPTWETILSGANGHLAFAVQPEALDASIFDLWAANLVTALVPSLDSQPAAVLNCAAMAFILKDGVLTDRVIGLDTSRVRVQGRGSVDFDSGRLRLKLKPQAKKPAFFSLATPVGVKGTIDAPEIDISIWEVTKSVGRFLVSIVVVPVKRIFVDPLPPDGTADMLEDMRRAIDGILQESRAGEVLDSAAAPFADAVPLTRPESSP